MNYILDGDQLQVLVDLAARAPQTSGEAYALRMIKASIDQQTQAALDAEKAQQEQKDGDQLPGGAPSSDAEYVQP